MTKNRKAKQIARAFARATGVSYTAARRLTGGGGAGTGGTSGQPGQQGEWEELEARSVEDLLDGAPQSECDRLIGETIRPRNDSAAGASRSTSTCRAA